MDNIALSLDSVRGRVVDVVIAGGGLAGLTLARQLRQTHPELSVVVLEKSRRPLSVACHKVGESSVELASQYFERLGLEEYLLENHIVKFGLRFFPGGGDLPIAQRAELGPAHEPIVRSYQLDRGIFETDLRGMIEEDGAVLVEGATVRDVSLESGKTPHTVTFTRDGEQETLTCRWFVDATGRNALLRRKLRMTRGNRHTASAGWFRIDGRFDITDIAPESERAWHEEPFASDRWRSTNHFMDEGYWVWVIPLSSGKTSIGVVVHEDTHSFDDVRTLDRCRAFIRKHEPVLADALEPHEALDFLCLKDYSHNVGRPWSGDRWAVTGEAGAFVDPFYSPGSDFIAFANSFTVNLIETDLAGGDLDARANELCVQYRALVLGNVDVYRTSSVTYGHARAMLAKIYWDNFAYWCFPCQYFLRGIYKETGASHARFATVGARFVELSNYVQALLSSWARLAPETPPAGFHGMPAFPSALVDTHLALQNEMTPDETHAYMAERVAEGEFIVAELLVRTLFELPLEKGRQLIEDARVLQWDVRVPAERIEAEPEIGLARRRALSTIARDIERSLGRARTVNTGADVAALLGPLVRHEEAAAAAPGE